MHLPTIAIYSMALGLSSVVKGADMLRFVGLLEAKVPVPAQAFE